MNELCLNVFSFPSYASRMLVFMIYAILYRRHQKPFMAYINVQYLKIYYIFMKQLSDTT